MPNPISLLSPGTAQGSPSLSLAVPLLATGATRLAPRQLAQWAQELPLGNIILTSQQMLKGCNDALTHRYDG